MSTPAEREAREAVKQACKDSWDSEYWQGVSLDAEVERALDTYCAAILAAARERVEALHETFVREALSDDAAADLLRQLVNAERNQMPLPTAIVYWKPFERHVAALDDLARAITEAP